MTSMFAEKASLGPVLAGMLAERQVYGGRQTNGEAHLARVTISDLAIGACRTVEPLKCLFFGPRYDLGDYFGAAREPGDGRRAIVGARACDVAAMKVLDHVFLGGEVVDPHYKALRDDTLIISADCTEPRDSCFCTLWGGSPHPTDGYDLNLSAADGGYVLEAGSEAGEQLLREGDAALNPAGADQLEARDSRRRDVAAQVDELIRKAGIEAGVVERVQTAMQESESAPLWDELAQKCVECGACNLICPTCHCFLLVDLQERHGFRRFRNWDACTYPKFAREASGVNPRARRAERLHGRFEKKLDFLKNELGTWGCVGCGRCVEACAGKIDVRDALRELTHA